MQNQISSSVASVLLLPYLIAELTFGFTDITSWELGVGSLQEEKGEKNASILSYLSELPTPNSYTTLGNGEINFTSVFNLTK